MPVVVNLYGYFRRVKFQRSTFFAGFAEGKIGLIQRLNNRFEQPHRLKGVRSFKGSLAPRGKSDAQPISSRPFKVEATNVAVVVNIHQAGQARALFLGAERAEVIA